MSGMVASSSAGLESGQSPVPWLCLPSSPVSGKLSWVSPQQAAEVAQSCLAGGICMQISPSVEFIATTQLPFPLHSGFCFSEN